jgi:uncharacterized protein (TIGR02996 family)
MMARLGALEDDLIAAVVEAPDLDAPRLVYAGWLRGRGDLRGELISLQITGSDPVRERELLATHGPRWAGEIASLTRSYRFVRGFIETIEVDVPVFVDHHDLLFARAPLLRDLRFNRCPSADDARRLFACPALSRARTLALYGPHVGEAFADLVASPHIASVERLQLSHTFVGERLVDLSTSPHLGRLRELNVIADHVGAAGAAALIDGFALVRSFSFAMTGFRGAWVEPRLPREIDSLTVTSNELGTEAARQLAASAWRPVLLDLSRNRLGMKAAAVLLSASFCERVEYLNLANNMIGDAGAHLLATAPHFARLRHANLESNRITDEGKAALRGRFGDVVIL